MTSLQPYLIRALLAWISDNGKTPHMTIDCAAAAGGELPLDAAKDGKLTLNISATATRNFHVDDERVSLDCRFGGRAVHIDVPVTAVVSVYAKEPGVGMRFAQTTAQPVDEQPTSGRPKLRLVK